MSLNFPPVIGFETSKHNASATFYPTLGRLVLNASQSRFVAAMPPGEAQGLVREGAANIMPSDDTLAGYGAVASRFSKFFTIAGYLPFIGSTVGLIRLVAGAVFLIVAFVFAEGINPDYLPALKTFGLKMIGRGLVEFFNFGLILLIPDLLATLYREVRSDSSARPPNQLWTPARVFTQ